VQDFWYASHAHPAAFPRCSRMASDTPSCHAYFRRLRVIYFLVTSLPAEENRKLLLIPLLMLLPACCCQ
jgi:hypothetical protein